MSLSQIKSFKLQLLYHDSKIHPETHIIIVKQYLDVKGISYLARNEHFLFCRNGFYVFVNAEIMYLQNL
jgi:hypothetical protein